jgi:hypothetical protein
VTSALTHLLYDPTTYLRKTAQGSSDFAVRSPCQIMEVHLLATRLTVLLFCLLASADAQDAQDVIFTAPSNSPDLTLVLNNKYLVQWTTDWPSIDLYVFCSGSERGGVGPNGANILYSKEIKVFERRVCVTEANHSFGSGLPHDFVQLEGIQSPIMRTHQQVPLHDQADG